MVAVLEGHDLSGKTTLADATGRKLGVPVVKPWADLEFARPSLTSVSRTLLSVVRASGGDYIFDRFITSEYVYGKLLGRPTDYLDSLLEEWCNLQMKVVVIEVGEHEIERRYRTRGDKLHSLERIKEARTLYRKLDDLMGNRISVIHCIGAEEASAALRGCLT